MSAVNYRAATAEKDAAARVTLTVEGALAVELAKVATDADTLREELRQTREALRVARAQADLYRRFYHDTLKMTVRAFRRARRGRLAARTWSGGVS